MIEIKNKSLLTFDVQTPFGKAQLSVKKLGKKIDVVLNHALVNQSFEADKVETAEILEKILKWIAVD